MRPTSHPLAAGLAATALLATGLAASLPRATAADALLERPLQAALERAQARLEAGVTVYEARDTLANPWRARSEHYDVASTRFLAQAEELATSLEQMLEPYGRILGTDFRPAERLAVTVVPDLATYRKLGEDFGDARSSYYSAFLAVEDPARPVYVLPGRTALETLIFATNGAAQQYVDRAFGRRPEPWIEQGLGAYFSMYWAFDWGAGELQRLIREDEYVPLPEVLGATIDAYATDSHARVVELGMFLTYLLHVRPETRIPEDGGEAPATSFQDYVQDALRGRPIARHPFRAWLTENADAIERDFRAHYLQ